MVILGRHQPLPQATHINIPLKSLVKSFVRRGSRQTPADKQKTIRNRLILDKYL
jgi:hypothetical protein